MARVWTEKPDSSAFSFRDTIPKFDRPSRVSVIPREEPPVCTSIRIPGLFFSKRAAISLMIGATVLEPVIVIRCETSSLLLHPKIAVVKLIDKSRNQQQQRGMKISLGIDDQRDVSVEGDDSNGQCLRFNEQRKQIVA